MSITAKSTTTELLNQANGLAGQQRWAEAEALLGKLLEQRPGHFGARLHLCDALLAQRKHRAAREAALAIHAMAPDKPSILMALMTRLRLFNECEAIFDCMTRLAPPDRLPINQLLCGATVMSLIGEQQRALELLDEAMRGDPDFPPTLLSQGQVLGYFGRIEEAENQLDRCIARAPEIARAHWLRSRLRKVSTKHNHVDALRQRIDLASDPMDRATLAFALHKELDDLGDYEAAWQALAQACAVRRSMLRYSTTDSVRLTDALIGRCDRDQLAAQAETIGTTPIFIVGMHRSGTTLLEQLLDGHSDVHGVGELYDFTSQMRYATDHHCRGVIDETIVERAGGVDFTQVGAEYLRKMHWRLSTERFFTDKLPSNFLNLGFICQALPQAKILHMVRDPIETCFSNLRELFGEANAYSYDQLELADFHACYQRLMAHWQRMWPGRIFDVNYSNLVRDPEATMREVTAFCGIEFQPSMLELGTRKRGVATASAIQIRQAISVPAQPKWAPYEAYLHPLIHALHAPD